MTAAIRVENVSKCYRLYKANEQIPSASLREELGRLARWSSRWFRREATDAPEEFWALKDVSFEVTRGEVRKQFVDGYLFKVFRAQKERISSVSSVIGGWRTFSLILL